VQTIFVISLCGKAIIAAAEQAHAADAALRPQDRGFLQVRIGLKPIPIYRWQRG